MPSQSSLATLTKSQLRIVQIMMKTLTKVRTRSSKDWSKTASPPRNAVKRRRLSSTLCNLMLSIFNKKTKNLRKRSTTSPWCCTLRSRRTLTSSVSSIRHSSRTNLSWLKSCLQTKVVRLAILLLMHHTNSTLRTPPLILLLTTRQIFKVCLLNQWIKYIIHTQPPVKVNLASNYFRLLSLRSNSKITRLPVELSCLSLNWSPLKQTRLPLGLLSVIIRTRHHLHQKPRT